VARIQLKQVFGAVVRRRREQAGLSQEALGDRAGLHRVYVYLVEKGRRSPSIDVVHKLATGLDTSMASLLGEVERQMKRARRAPE
jgi:transcriptional regulator with XRE-family HTH domain